MQAGQQQTSNADEGLLWIPPENQDFDQNLLISNHDSDLNAWLQSAPFFSKDISVSGITEHLPSFEENTEYSSGRVIYQQSSTGQFSGRKEGLSALISVCNQVGNEEDDANTKDETKRRNRKRSAVEHNFSERFIFELQQMRRQKLKDKMNVIQEMLPSSSKRDMASTLEETIEYIKTLQSLIQAMYSGSYYSMLNSPMMSMMSGNFAMQLPFPFLQNDAATVMAMGMRMLGMFPSSMSQLGLPNPQLLTSVTTSVLPGMTAGTVSESLQSATLSALQFSIGKEAAP